MRIEVHMIQNHSPANLNRDDLGAPKTCYFGGVLRSRISSQCLKRSIRMSDEFKDLRGGIRTRRLAEKIAELVPNKSVKARAQKIMGLCGISTKKPTKSASKEEDSDAVTSVANSVSGMLVFTTYEAVQQMAELFSNEHMNDDEMTKDFAALISNCVFSPDMALCGRMLETGKIPNTTVEAALQVSHAISTHVARPEIDYFVAADDVPGDDVGAGIVGEVLFASACFYKYFSIDWEQLVSNLNGNKDLAAHTVGAFFLAAAKTNPSGKQNSYAAHNYPDCILIEFKDAPVSYANAFVRPVSVVKDSDLVDQSIGQFATYVRDINNAYFPGQMQGNAFWFSPNGRYPLNRYVPDINLDEVNTLNDLLQVTLNRIGGYEWEVVRQANVYVGG